MRKFFKYLLFLLLLTIYAILFAGVDYITPHYEVTNVTGVEVKRVDKDGPITKANPADGPTRDVYYIYTQKPNESKPMVYRNEDTRWGFPFYFKFDSADLQAKAQNFANESKLIEVKYYGWRLIILDEFRNAVSIKEVTLDKGQSYSILAYVLYAFLFITLFFAIQFIRGWFDSEK
ncbi:uncharacterized protein DUF1523 [Bisgaardia hudsonensis]|uniref:Uncharacterized protein DUF1523 n=1 Tax=Bisgaardia hudsonensis TaxID=109472 RepID=A0A4R2MX36_9PAST|nr:DUF1523 family protein [Bisgaardia hudsonensis]QLB13656.1 hypothetical protein A6A11_08565 [Bisgaardia hudsonensis]TCP11989.1 uncharacterized protein DUF1523 [Bisgaardia hudsonensis]